MTFNFDTVQVGDAQKRLDVYLQDDHPTATFRFLQEWQRYVTKKKGDLTLALRARTGATLLVCRAALVKAEWDFEKAVFYAEMIEARAA